MRKERLLPYILLLLKMKNYEPEKQRENLIRRIMNQRSRKRIRKNNASVKKNKNAEKNTKKNAEKRNAKRR